MINDFSQLSIKRAYDSGMDDILHDFYIPVLEKANRYDRIAGFFSSSTLAVAAKGMAGLIKNGGKMRLVTCPKLSHRDVEMLKLDADGLDEKIISNFISSEDEIQDEFEYDHVKAMGWMLSKDLLEIRIAVIKRDGIICDEEEINNSGIMHQKVGVLYDQCGNVITFSGSNNESAGGWINNTEEFKVFASWDTGYPYYHDDIKKFDSFWEKDVRNDVEIKTVPQALNERLIEEGKDFNITKIAVSRYPSNKDNSDGLIKLEKEQLRLYDYQKAAVNMWEENNRCLIFQMATGSGKTRTAIGCMSNAMKDTKPLLIIIATPQTTLSVQWKKDIEKLDIPSKYSMLADSTASNWRKNLQKEILFLSIGKYPYLIVYTTHATCSSTDFINIISSKTDGITKFFIGDEVHGMGSKEQRKGLLDCYTYKLGLSATPQRWFDDSGSKLIQDYFGNNSYIYSVRQALLARSLVEYYYYPCFISLTEDELNDYIEKTKEIARKSHFKKTEEEKYNTLDRLRMARADIEKNAYEKYQELDHILDKIGDNIKNTIIFVSPEQINEVMKMLGRRGISASRFTKDQGTNPEKRYGGKSERDYIIDLFKQEKYQVLVAIKCLDEGIDIPSAETAIIMASTTNPREYVQRIGRIIRRFPGKQSASIYDMVVRPNIRAIYDDNQREMEKRIFTKELIRVNDLSRESLNNSNVNAQIYQVMQEADIHEWK